MRFHGKNASRRRCEEEVDMAWCTVLKTLIAGDGMTMLPSRAAVISFACSMKCTCAKCFEIPSRHTDSSVPKCQEAVCTFLP